MPVRENIEAVRREIADACRAAGRSPSEIRLIAVTKSQGTESLTELAAAGVFDYGENRLDHLATMAASVPAGARFHHIGRIQSRQISDIARLSACVHGLAELDHARRLDRACAALRTRMPVFVQVNTSGETSKAGCAPEQLPGLLDALRPLPALDIVGLMTMAPALSEGGNVDDDEAPRRAFAALRELARHHALPRLSMGMSGDFPVAIREGATDVRIGSRLFR